MLLRRAVVITLCVFLPASCGGGSGSSPATTPTSPTTPTTPGIDACAAIAGTSSASGVIAPRIVNGTECSTAGTSVVKLNMSDASGNGIGSCSGTIIGPRSILTAAHCLAGGVGTVQAFLGFNPVVLVNASSFASYPGYREGDPNGLDVGVVRFAADLGRGAIPVLVSRDARVGETAVIAGWGNDLNSNAGTLRAGSAVITSAPADGAYLQTQFTTTASSVCQGDSGGPLLLQEGGVWAVAGIVSATTTTACSSGANYYANVRNSAIASFIRSQAPDAVTR